MRTDLVDRNKILDCLTSEWQGSREIWLKINTWSEISLRNHLRAMCDAGTVERCKEAEQNSNRFRYMYRRKPEIAT